jgi:1,4-alpha-glucan branching enzyme
LTKHPTKAISGADKLDLQRILDAQHHDPFSFLGIHLRGSDSIVRVFNPHAQGVCLKSGDQWLALEKPIPTAYSN